MTVHDINLTSIKTHGKAQAKIVDEILEIWTTHSITPPNVNLYGKENKRHCVSLPEQYRLPFRIDMTVMLDYPWFMLFVGDGRITFATPQQDNRKIEDIAFPSGKPNQDNGLYNNKLTFGEWVDISITYNLDEIQVCVNGEERFYSRKMSYMNKKNLHDLNVQNLDGFAIGLAVTKGSVLRIKSLNITEYDDNALIKRGSFDENILKPVPQENRPKPTFESVIQDLPQELHKEVMQMDIFLKSLRPLKFRRTVDKGGGKISWVASDYGISYHVEPSGSQLTHRFGWYIITSSTPDKWHRKADYMEDTLNYIAKSNKGLSERIFYALSDCTGCSGSCAVKTRYEFAGEKRNACHGTVTLRMSHDDFCDVREFFRSLNDFITEKELPL